MPKTLISSPRYESLAQQNEVLRAQLGSLGLPTESTPEEDMDLQDLHSLFEAARKENGKLREKLTSYERSHGLVAQNSNEITKEEKP